LKRYQNSFHPLCFTAINAFISACYADEMNSSMRNSEKRLFDNSKSFNRKDKSVTYRLHDDLLRFYRKGTRPVMHPNKLITVSMSVFLYQIIKLDAVKNTISLSGSFELYWKDEFLQWEPRDYDHATEIFLSSSDIWIPEFSLYYSHHYDQAVKLVSNNDVRVNYTGHIRYYIPFSTESLCKLDVKFFPFDIQQCTLLFGSWAHSNDSIKYSLYSQNLSLIDFYDNQEWQLDLIHSNIASDGFLYDYLDPPLFWEMIIMNLVVVRQSFYYVFNLVIPSTIITLVAVIGFHTPSTSGRVRDAKFRLGIMTLMSMSVILLAIVEDMPKFSMSSRKGRGSFSGIPLIGLYYFILLAIIGLSTVSTSVFVFLEKDLRVTHQVPWFLAWLSFDTPLGNIISRLKNRARSIALSMLQLIQEDENETISSCLLNILEETKSLQPRDETHWQTVIRRLEILSLSFYIALITTTVFLFFYHDWYCAIGHNVCGQPNLKCPWMHVDADAPECI
uniref:Neur_chan_LBD domain-containing protein n=1 Tax=Dracunculus medinensis TaxID=318479 RepID=A0A158Q2J0_DRAME